MMSMAMRLRRAGSRPSPAKNNSNFLLTGSSILYTLCPAMKPAVMQAEAVPPDPPPKGNRRRPADCAETPPMPSSRHAWVERIVAGSGGHAASRSAKVAKPPPDAGGGGQWRNDHFPPQPYKFVFQNEPI